MPMFIEILYLKSTNNLSFISGRLRPEKDTDINESAGFVTVEEYHFGKKMRDRGEIL